MSATSMRTHRAGDLRASDIGATVTVCGWVGARRDHGGVLFLDLRDAGGMLQVVVDPGTPAGATATVARSEYVLRITGTVRARPAGTVNAALGTGEVELQASEVEVLAASEPPPIPVDERVTADENLRLTYRYLDLRSPRLQRNLRIRARVNRAIREALDGRGFVEVETPMLMRSTPEGARDFLVPSRLSPGEFYALPQSPQLFKQLLMVGGLDRYYQIARCLRDEDLRADRQFEFMQLDLEMSFAAAADVREVIAAAVRHAIEAVTAAPAPPIPELTWHEAMARFGSDKPDLRFAMELCDLSGVFAATELRALRAECVVGLAVPGGGALGRARLDALVARARELGAAGLVWLRVLDDGLDSPVAKFLSEPEQADVRTAVSAAPGDLVLVVAGPPDPSRKVLGALRLELGRLDLGSPPLEGRELRCCWVVDFPLFDGIDDAGRLVPAHHPFTMVHPDDAERFAAGARGDLAAAELLGVRSLAYDLVINGWELGSGSVRIHEPGLQQQVFSLLGITPEEARAKFGFLLDAFRYGAPPHAGFAFGIDRLAALLAGEDNIREVIAFPKTQSGADPLTGAPTPAAAEQLRELGLAVLPRRADGG